MCLHRNFILTMVAVSAAVLPATGYSACDARSGPKTAALVELYTSEGCSSCPPADRQLSHLRQILDPAAEVVPLALHVGYWDYIGWKDPYAQEAFAERQRWLVRANRQRAVYTPQFFVGGADLRSRQGGLREQVRQLNASPAAATIRVQAAPTASGTLTLSAEARTAIASPPAALYLAVTESGLVSKVMRGENSGATLAHDHVVRTWIGPIRLTDGATRVERDIVLPADGSRARLDVVAFVQDERSGSVLQALLAQGCMGS
ncbi:MAG: DUF1223 domain-containing protein [Sulfuritalea sp.]|nr:DUF1223 domain-containing protein [Sulfuritalea sp.]